MVENKKSYLKEFIKFHMYEIKCCAVLLIFVIGLLLAYPLGKWVCAGELTTDIEKTSEFVVKLIYEFMGIVLLLTFLLILLVVSCIVVKIKRLIVNNIKMNKAIKKYCKLPLTLQECQSLHLNTAEQYVDYIYKQLCFERYFTASEYIYEGWKTCQLKLTADDFEKISEVLLILSRKESYKCKEILQKIKDHYDFYEKEYLCYIEDDALWWPDAETWNKIAASIAKQEKMEKKKEP